MNMRSVVALGLGGLLAASLLTAAPGAAADPSRIADIVPIEESTARALGEPGPTRTATPMADAEREDLAAAADRAERTGTDVRLIVDARDRRLLTRLGVEIGDRIGTLPQFKATASGSVLTRVIDAGLDDAIGLDLWVPRPRVSRATSPQREPRFRPTDFAGVVGATELRKAGITGKGVTVALLDDGIDVDHPFLEHVNIKAQGCFVENHGHYPIPHPCRGGKDVVIGEGAADVGRIRDFTHGTHVGGIMVGDPTGIADAKGIWGIAPGADLVVGRVFGDYGAPVSDIVAGLDWVARLAKRHSIKAVNLSLGMSLGSRWNCAAFAKKNYGPVFKRLQARDVAIVAATGNEGNPAAESAPACGEGVVAVSSIGADGKIAWFSNISPQTDLLAPGEHMQSSLNGGDFGLAIGTSASAPIVVGAYALAHQAKPGLSSDTWLGYFRSYSVPVDDLITKDLPLIQINDAVQAARGTPPPGRPLRLKVEEVNLATVNLSWKTPSSGSTPDEYVVRIGDREMRTSQTSLRIDEVYQAPALITVTPLRNGVPGPSASITAFPIDPSAGAVHGGRSVVGGPPFWDYCSADPPSLSILYVPPLDAPIRTLRVANADAVEIVLEMPASIPSERTRQFSVTDQRLWNDRSTVVQVVSRTGTLGPRWSIGNYVVNSELLEPRPPQPTDLRAGGGAGRITLEWSGNGALSWQVFLDGEAVTTTTTPSASIAAEPGTHTVGVCALGDSNSPVRGSVMTTALATVPG